MSDIKYIQWNDLALKSKANQTLTCLREHLRNRSVSVLTEQR